MNVGIRPAVEVEVRGPVAPGKVDELLARLSREGEYKGLSDRFFVSFAIDEMRSQGIDLRVRMTNGHTQIVAKVGKFLGEMRTETIVDVGAGQFKEAVALLGILGIHGDLAARRIIHNYQLNDLLLSVVEVPGHSWFYEAEKICSEDDKESCRKQIMEQLNLLGLDKYSEDEFMAYVKTLDAEANIFFDTRTKSLESLSLFPK